MVNDILHYLAKNTKRFFRKIKGWEYIMSNVLENKGNSNDILKEWSKKYTVHYLNNTYGNCNYHAKDKSNNSTVEVLITNY